MEKKDLVDLATIYIKLHNLVQEDEKFLIRKLNSLKTENEVLTFLLTGGSFNIQEDIMGHSFSKDTDKAADYMITRLWKYLFGEVTGKDWETTKNNAIDIAQNVGSGFQIGATAISVLILTALIIKAIKFIREKLLVKERKECKGLVGVRKDLCEVKYDLMIKRMEMNVVKKGLAVCPKTKNPSQCRQKLESRLNNIKVDITKKQSEMKDLMEKARNKKR